MAAKRKELDGFLHRRTRKVVLKHEVPLNAKILGARFVLLRKDANKPNLVFKARLVVQGNCDREKAALFHDVTSMSHTSIKDLMTIAAVFGFQI